MNDLVPMAALVLAGAALRIVSGGALPPSLVPAQFVSGNAIKAGVSGGIAAPATPDHN